MNQNNEDQATPVPRVEGAKQAGDPRDPWWWVERSVWTERMLTRLTSGESADRVWYALADKTYAPPQSAKRLYEGVAQWRGRGGG